MSQDIEDILFEANKVPRWVEEHKDKFNALVYKSLKQQNRLFEVAMQKMLFGSLSKDLQDEIKEQAQEEAAAQAAGGGGGEQDNSSGSAGDDPSTVLFIDGAVPTWIDNYRDSFSSLVYKSLKSQGKLTDASMQEMLFNSLSQDIREDIKEEVEEARKKAEAAKSAAPTTGGSGGAGGGGNLEPLLNKISSQLDEIITLLKER